MNNAWPSRRGAARLNKYFAKIISRFRKGDVILIACAITAACATAIVTAFGGGAGAGAAASKAVISVDGKVWREVPLNIDSRYEIISDGRYNAVVIENGRARMEDAGCPDKLCVKQGAISDAREVIVCLPNRVSVRLEKAAGAYEGVDVIAGVSAAGR